MKYTIMEEVDAFKWTGGPDQTEEPEWISKAIKSGQVRFKFISSQVLMFIDTPTGTDKAQLGDYVIKDARGSIYSCGPETFKFKYAPVKGQDLE